MFSFAFFPLSFFPFSCFFFVHPQDIFNKTRMSSCFPSKLPKFVTRINEDNGDCMMDDGGGDDKKSKGGKKSKGDKKSKVVKEEETKDEETKDEMNDEEFDFMSDNKKGEEEEEEEGVMKLHLVSREAMEMWRNTIELAKGGALSLEKDPFRTVDVNWLKCGCESKGTMIPDRLLESIKDGGRPKLVESLEFSRDGIECKAEFLETGELASIKRR